MKATTYGLAEVFTAEKATKAIEITQAAHFLFVNLQFFLAPISADAKAFQTWAQQHKKEMESLTQDLKMSQDKLCPRDYNILGEFFKALQGNPLIENDQACLLYADFKPIIMLLNNSPPLLANINKHLQNPIIDMWFKDKIYQEDREQRRKKIAEPTFIQQWPKLLQDILIHIEKLSIKDKDALLGRKETKAELIIATRQGDELKVKTLLAAKANPDQQNTYLATALTVAASLGHVAIIQLLLKAGAALNIQDDNKYSALIRATQKKQQASIILLITAKANLNLRDQDGNNAIMIAIKNNDHKAVAQLLPSNLNMVNKKQQTPITLAIKKKSQSILALLIHHIITEKRDIDLTSKIKDNFTVAKHLREYNKTIQNTNKQLYQRIYHLLRTHDEDIDSDCDTEPEEEYDENKAKIAMNKSERTKSPSQIQQTKAISKFIKPLITEKKSSATSLKLPLQKHRWAVLRLVLWRLKQQKQAALPTPKKEAPKALQLA